MPTESRILATDGCVDRAVKCCTNCGRWKARDQFPRNRAKRDNLESQCKQCRRNAAYTHYHEGGGKAVKAAYGVRPEVKAHRLRDAARQARRKAAKALYEKSPRGKLVQCRSKARAKLRRATSDEQRGRLEALVAACDREFARLDQLAQAARDHELPQEPLPPADDCDYRGVIRKPDGRFEVLVHVPGRGQVYGGSHATIEAAKREADRLGRDHLGVEEYAVPKWRRRDRKAGAR